MKPAMEKLFPEHDWENENSEQRNFSFAKQKATKKKRDKPKRSNNLEEPGRFVRAPPADDVELVATTNSKHKSVKRKCNETVDQHRHVTELSEPKNKKHKNGSVAKDSLIGEAKIKPQSKTLANPSNFREKLVESLKGSRFRFINEQLYKTTSVEAKRLFQEDPGAFQAYHEGYRHQIGQWSVNPLDRIIKSFSKLPADYVVADFGCGEARLAEAIEQKVYSLDFVAANSSVIACDMANTPLETNSINAVVFCLSLMGTNLRDFLLEANRVLKVGGLLKIAEVSSRYDNVKEFIDCVHKCGYLLDNKDLSHKLFYFFNFKKVRSVDKSSLKGKHFSLKPCLYKKR